MTDKDGKELRINSIIAFKPPGKERYTVKGSITRFENDIIYFKDNKKEFERAVNSNEVKRIRLKPTKNKRDNERRMRVPLKGEKETPSHDPQTTR